MLPVGCRIRSTGHPVDAFSVPGRRDARVAGVAPDAGHGDRLPAGGASRTGRRDIRTAPRLDARHRGEDGYVCRFDVGQRDLRSRAAANRFELGLPGRRLALARGVHDRQRYSWRVGRTRRQQLLVVLRQLEVKVVLLLRGAFRYLVRAAIETLEIAATGALARLAACVTQRIAKLPRARKGRVPPGLVFGHGNEIRTE